MKGEIIRLDPKVIPLFFGRSRFPKSQERLKIANPMNPGADFVRVDSPSDFTRIIILYLRIARDNIMRWKTGYHIQK